MGKMAGERRDRKSKLLHSEEKKKNIQVTDPIVVKDTLKD